MNGVRIGNEFLDPPVNEEITVELNLGLFDEEVIPGSLTFPNNFPATDRNNRIFGQSHRIDVAPKIEAMDGVFYIAGNPIDSCKVIRLESSKDVHRVSIILNGIAMDLKGKKLSDVDTSQFDQEFTTIPELIDWMYQCNKLGSEDLFVWPRMRNGKAFEDVEHPGHMDSHFDGILNRWSDVNLISPYAKNDTIDTHFPRYFFSPKIRELKLLKLLFEQYGYSVTGTFFQQPEQQELSFYTNRLLLCDRRDIVQISQLSYNADFYIETTSLVFPDYTLPLISVHFPSPELGQTALDQDYNDAVGVYVDNPFGSMSFPDSLFKIKLSSAKHYKAAVKGTILTSSIVPAANFFLVAEAGTADEGKIIGMYPVSITGVTAEVDSYFECVVDLDLPAAPSVWDLTANVYLICGISTPADNATQISNYILEVAEVIEGDAEMEIETISASKFLPDISIDDWLIGLKSNFNLRFAFNPFTKEVTIDYRTKALTAPVWVIDRHIGNDVPFKTLTRKTGYAYSYSYDSAPGGYGDNKVSALTRSQIAGYAADDTYPGMRLFASPIDGLIYRHVSQSSSQGQYFLGPQVTGDGSTSIEISGRIPMLMEVYGLKRILQPFIEMSMRAERYEQYPSPLEYIFMTYYRGMIFNESGTDQYPTASSLATAPDGETSIGDIELWFAIDRPKSVYNLCFRRWQSFERFTERLRDSIRVDYGLIQKFYTHQLQVLNTVFVPDKLLFTLTESGIGSAEIEMYRNNYEYGQE